MNQSNLNQEGTVMNKTTKCPVPFPAAEWTPEVISAYADECYEAGLKAAQAENERLRVGLRFYAQSHHYTLDETEDFDTVSGESENWLCSGVDNSATMIEDGTIARRYLRGKPVTWIDGDEDMTPLPIEGEAE